MFTDKEFTLKRRQKDFIINNMSDVTLEKLWQEFDEKFHGGADDDVEREWLENKCIALLKEGNIVIPSEEELEEIEFKEMEAAGS